MNQKPEDDDLGGERACWLDEVCPECGGMGGHRNGCEAQARDEAVRGEADLPAPSYVSKLTGRPTLIPPLGESEQRSS